MRTYWMRGSVLALAFVAAGCSDGAGVGVGTDGLSPAERTAVATAMIARAATATSPPVSRGGTAQGVDSEYDFAFSATDVCQPSGNIALNGSAHVVYSAEAEGGTLDANLTITHTACAVAMPAGEPVIVTGDPALQVRLTGESADGRIVFVDVHETGAFTWRRGSSAGRCTVDLTGHRDAVGSVRVSGSFCGHTVDVTTHVQ